MALEFEIKGIHYRTKKMDVFVQSHVMRRLLPIISSLATLAKLQAPASADGSSGTDIKEAFGPIASALSELSDESFNYILSACLNVCQRNEGGNNLWVPVWNNGAKRLQFDDIDLPAMLNICGKVIGENLSGFFPEGPSTLKDILGVGQK